MSVVKTALSRSGRTVINRRLTLLAFATLAYAISTAAQAQQAIAAAAVGVWKLQSTVIHNVKTGKDTKVPITTGYLTFVRDGTNLRGSANLAAPGRREAGGTATNAEAVQLFRSYTAYSGTVALAAAATAEGTPVKTTIDVDLNQSGLGTFSRTYAIDGTKLTITSKPSPELTSTAVFEKAQ